MPTGPHAACGRCGRVGPLAQRATPTEPALGRCCWQPPEAICTRCGRRRPCRHAHTDHPVCDGCSPTIIECSRCGRQQRVAARLGDERLCARCWRAHRAATTHCRRCRATAALTGGLCPGCQLVDRVDELRSAAAPHIARRLGRYLDALARSPNPASTLRWMHTPSIALLRRLVASQLELSHDALDAEQGDADEHCAVAFLRAALVEHGALEPRDETSASFARWSSRALRELPDGPDQARLRAYATWQIAPRLAHANDRGTVKPSTVKHAHAQLRQAILLAHWLHQQDLGLSDLRQDLLEQWLAEGASTRRDVHGFVAWLAHGSDRPLRIHWPAAASQTLLDDQERHRALHQLIDDGSLDPRLRFAGALVLLLGQPLTRICALRHDDLTIHDGRVYAQLGPAPIELPSPIGALALELRDRAAGLNRAAAAIASPWLLPGRKHGEHLTAEHLRIRLKALGITTRPARRSALLALAGELPAPILAQHLAISPGRAAQWTRLAATTYADYLADERPRGGR